MERRTKPNLQGTSAGVGFRSYALSVAVWWYVLVRLWVELFVSQILIQVETTVSRKASTWSKGNKDGNKTKIKLEQFYMVALLPKTVGGRSNWKFFGEKKPSSSFNYYKRMT